MSAAKYSTETITEVRTWVPGKLFSFRCTRNPGFQFTPGQFARLGVRSPSTNEILWRAYSMVSGPHDDYLEFFSIVVEEGAFTNVLVNLKPGDTIYVERTAYGFMTLERFAHNERRFEYLWMMASGTGLGPFLSILAHSQVWQEFDRIILVHSVRHPEELAYADEIQAYREKPGYSEYFLGRPNKLTYVPVVTRAPNADSRWLTRRLPQLIDSGELEAAAQAELDPLKACVMLCGNPEMVTDLRQLLHRKGFRAPRRGQPGNLTVEHYW